MALQFIKALRAINVEYIVAPYEADAQLGYLARENYIAAVISEDSDLLLFGCQRVLYKMDKFGEGVLIDQKDFANCLELDLQNWTLDQLRRMCILSGCDYLDSISGIGLKTANKLLIRYKTVQNVVTHMRKKMMDVPRDYEDLFLQAENTFKYQRVVHPGSLELTHVTPVPDAVDISQMDYIGPILEPHVARGIALGNINPNTMACMDNYDPNATMVVSSKEVVETDADSCAAPCANTEPSSTRLTIPKPMWIAPKAFKNRFSAFSATSNLAPLQNQASILQFLKPSEGASRGFKAPAQAPVAPPASPPAGDVPITPLRRYPASDAQPRISKQSAAIIGSFARKRTFEQASSDHAEQSEDQSESAAQASMAEEENDEDVFLSPELAQEALMPNETADPSSAVNLFGPTWLEDMRTYLVHQHEEASQTRRLLPYPSVWSQGIELCII
ncbi:exodeoxyribonuclease 1 [Capsaspora owczarzaki ATCC 30864]|uniref:exodeoxyribonuclease 1 n=1 Tax=Capsaspora owczarzaki (strain ATCC 30864) TaxID=595528 RepID=UPI0003526FCD|nr:exodeoxyribonuclease 1 [Capsaspora owczarzaki ATCC 30864]|eukprot:XP_004349261.2 exodeoxyribonuclease 1 [Capsaspora owczarzaki ATCC 30864]